MRLSKSDGSLQVYYASENNDGDQDILLQTSRDNGETWSNPPVTVAGATTTGRDGMPGCASKYTPYVFLTVLGAESTCPENRLQ